MEDDTNYEKWRNLIKHFFSLLHNYHELVIGKLIQINLPGQIISIRIAKSKL